jgi:hypothetical protein
LTPKGFVKYVMAYSAATLTCIPLAIAGAEVGRWFDYHMTWYHVAVPLWAAAVGLPSVGWSSQHLSRTLGNRPTPVLKVTGQRDIPVAGGLADAALHLFGAGPQRQPALAVADEVVISCGGYVFTESDLKPVLKRAWVRQRSGESPLSRRYWLGRQPFMGDRSKYDAFASSLEACGILVGRGDRSSGRLIIPPLTALHELRHKPYQ